MIPALLAAVALAACGREPVRWGEPFPVRTASASAAWVLDSASSPPGEPALVRAPPFAAPCTSTARVARDSARGDWYAVWWRPRADGTADLVASHSVDGAQWTPPVRVDTTDAERAGCRRAAPAVAAEGGNVFVAYAMTALEGPGIFASHSMDRGKLFHAPVAVVYGGGDHIGPAAVAARGNLVAIAYEDPNTEPRRVGLALSETMGHLFQWRMRVSPASGPARAPGVAIRDGRIAVTWLGGARSDSAQPVARIGVLR